MNRFSVLTCVALCVGATGMVRADDPVVEMKSWLENRYAPGALVEVVSGSMGHLFDCVDRDRQPALQRADGTFAPVARPPRSPFDDGASKLSANEVVADVETASCPVGSVPMMHVDLDTLQRFGSLRAFFAKYPDSQGTDTAMAPSGRSLRTGSTASHQYAGVEEFVSNWGGDAFFNLWNPYTDRASEFSLSQIGVTRGSGSDQQTLEAGWQELQNLYGDWEPHLFIYSTQDGYGSTGCYNGTCGDFVQVAARPVPGVGFTVYSTNWGRQYGIQLRWQRDDANDNWWLVYGTTWVGYYPGTLFDSAGVKNEASAVKYFGEIIDDDPVDHTGTDMGSGGNPSSGTQQVAFTRTLRTISTSNVWQAASSASEFRTDSFCYDVDLSFSAGVWRNYYYFGGEGYGTNCQ